MCTLSCSYHEESDCSIDNLMFKAGYITSMSLLKWLNSASKQRDSPLLPTEEDQLIKAANRQAEKEITQQDIKRRKRGHYFTITRHVQK